MSGDSTVTIDAALTWDHDPEGFRGSFARLKPINQPAKRAFQRAVDIVEGEGLAGETTEHLRQFITAERGADDGQWVGYFSLDMRKHSHTAGTWTFGSDPATVDLLLSPSSTPGQPSGAGVYPTHGQFFQDQHAATLMVRCSHAKSEVFLDNATEILTNGRMLESDTGLTIGVLLYRLEFAAMSRSELLAQITALRRQGQANYQLEYPSLLSPTPSTSSQRVQHEFLVGSVTHGGAQGSVSFVHRLRGGPPAVCKKFTVDRQNKNQVQVLQHEVDLLRHFSNEENVVHIAKQFDAALALSQLDTTSNQVVEILIIIEPAATHTLQDILDDPRQKGKYGVADIRRIARDWASGITVIHELPAIHADLKPSNLGLTTFLGLILDLGHTILGESSGNHYAGTIPFLAPEIMALKRNKPSNGTNATSPEPVTPSSDIYSLGLSLALWILHLRHPPWLSRSLSDDKGVQPNLLKQHIITPLAALRKDPPSTWVPESECESFKALIDTVCLMLNESPRYRMTAAEAVNSLGKVADFTPTPEPPRRFLELGTRWGMMRKKSENGSGSGSEGSSSSLGKE